MNQSFLEKKLVETTTKNLKILRLLSHKLSLSTPALFQNKQKSQQFYKSYQELLSNYNQVFLLNQQATKQNQQLGELITYKNKQLQHIKNEYDIYSKTLENKRYFLFQIEQNVHNKIYSDSNKLKNDKLQQDNKLLQQKMHKIVQNLQERQTYQQNLLIEINSIRNQLMEIQILNEKMNNKLNCMNIQAKNINKINCNTNRNLIKEKQKTKSPTNTTFKYASTISHYSNSQPSYSKASTASMCLSPVKKLQLQIKAFNKEIKQLQYNHQKENETKIKKQKVMILTDIKQMIKRHKDKVHQEYQYQH